MAQQVKNLPAMQETQETQVWPLGQEDPLEKEVATHSREPFPGQGSLMDYSAWCCKESDMTEQLNMHGSHIQVAYEQVLISYSSEG